VNLEFVWESKYRMQAEGGFGSRQFDIGCLDSVIEFGLQSIHRRQYNSACISIFPESWVFSKSKLLALCTSHSQFVRASFSPLWPTRLSRDRIRFAVFLPLAPMRPWLLQREPLVHFLHSTRCHTAW